MTRTGAQILWECLEREGVKHVFGYPGGAILPAYDALKHSDIHHILVRHEQGATHMADGYARASGEVGVAVATSGPGATNMVTGIATAMLDSSPIVCITGQVGSKLIGSDAFQETDITGITLPITKHNYLVTHADQLARVLREAFYVARSGRPGPVLVDITKDAQQSSCEFDWDAARPQLPGYRPDLSPEESEYAQALELIHKSKRPLILAGHGIIVSGAMAEVLTLAEKAGKSVQLLVVAATDPWLAMVRRAAIYRTPDCIDPAPCRSKASRSGPRTPWPCPKASSTGTRSSACASKTPPPTSRSAKSPTSSRPAPTTCM